MYGMFVTMQLRELYWVERGRKEEGGGGGLESLDCLLPDLTLLIQRCFSQSCGVQITVTVFCFSCWLYVYLMSMASSLVRQALLVEWVDGWGLG